MLKLSHSILTDTFQRLRTSRTWTEHVYYNAVFICDYWEDRDRALSRRH